MKKMICIFGGIVLIIISVFLYKNRYNFVEIKDDYFATILYVDTSAGYHGANLYFRNGKYIYIAISNFSEYWGGPLETRVTNLKEFNNESEFINFVLKNISEWSKVTLNIDVPERELKKGDIITAEDFKYVIENVINQDGGKPHGR